MFNETTPKKSPTSVISRIIGAVALGGLAVMTAKVIHSLQQGTRRAQFSICASIPLEKEDWDAIARMEGEGGPSMPMPPVPSM